MSDSETDSTTEDDIIENKAFPQQRFSPVMKHINSSDITYRPKPIKRIPETGKAGPNSPVGVSAGPQIVTDRPIPRPSSNGSNFQPTGAVFKAKTKQSRYLSTGSVQDNRHYEHDVLQRGESVSSLRAMQQMKIHNITMATGDEEKIIMSSNTESPFGNNQNSRGGAIMGKFSTRAPLKRQTVSTAPSILQQTLQTGAQGCRPVSTATIQIVASPQMAAMNQPVVSQNTVVPTFTTVGKPISASGLTATVLQNISQGNYSASTAIATVQPQTILPNTSAGPKNVGIVVQNVPASQYSMIIGSQAAVASPTVTKPPTLSAAGSGQLISTSLQTLVPSVTSQAAMPAQSVAQPTVLTNFILKPGQSGQSIQPALNSPLPPQSVSQTFNQTFQPTHFQYILPSIRMQNPAPGAKFQNHVIQMALPGTPVPQGSIQLAFAGNQANPTTQGMAQIQQVQVSPQQVHTPVQGGKIQLATGYKVVQSPIKQQPSPAASPQLNTAPQTIQVISQNAQTNKPTVTQYVALNHQSSGLIASPHPVQIQAAPGTQAVVSKHQNPQIQVLTLFDMFYKVLRYASLMESVISVDVVHFG